VFVIGEQRILISLVALWPKAGLGKLILEDSRSHLLDAPQLVGILWMSDQPDVETST